MSDTASELYGFQSTLRRHPLDPLSPQEVKIATTAVLEHVRRKGGDRNADEVRFIEVALKEADKIRVILAKHEPCEPFPQRHAMVIIWEKSLNRTSNVVVAVSTDPGKVLSSQVIEKVQPAWMEEEYTLVERVVRAYPPFVKAMKKRGLDVDNISIDPWCPGYFTPADDPAKRLARPLFYYRRNDTPGYNLYANPIEGIEMAVDLGSGDVWMFKDREVVPIPPPDKWSEYASLPPGVKERSDIKPLYIIQPEGPSFTVDGWRVNWQRYQFRIGFTSREGVVLHQVGYKDEGSGALTGSGSIRPIAYRMSFAEMVVPYGDPRDPHYRKNAFDAGEDGLGRNANSLSFGCDCLGCIHYFDGVLVDAAGDAKIIPNAICMHEEDDGLSWKHTNWRDGHVEIRRSRRLVISFICTINNYDYRFQFNLHQNGVIEMESKATGILSTGSAWEGETEENPRKFGTLVAPFLYAPIHSHTFVARLDMAVDGIDNSVYEMNIQTEPDGPLNPQKNGFFVEATRLKSEREARRIIDPFKSRTWKIASSSTLNRMKTHTSYKLVPYGNSLPHALPGAAYLRRAGFLKRHLWVTRYNPEEIFPGGWFPNQNPKSDGLPVWTRRDGNVEDTDVVVWYTFVLDHVPRLEDWPMVTMHVEKVGFCLVPNGFFNSTPAIDLPRQSLVQPSAGKGYSHTGPDGSYTLTGAPGSSLPNNVAGCASCPTGAAVPAPLPSKL